MYPVSSLLEEEKTLFQELYEYFRDRYFTVNLGRYENFTFSSGSLVTPTIIIVGIMIGVLIAGILVIRDRKVLGRFVRALINQNCNSQETAKTLSELGFDKDYSIRNSLRFGKRLRNVVHCVEQEQFEAAKQENQQKETGEFQWMNSLHYHFYIPAEKSIEADVRFDKEGNSWRAYLILIVVTVLVAIAVIYLFPDMLQMLDNSISIIKGTR